MKTAVAIMLAAGILLWTSRKKFPAVKLSEHFSGNEFACRCCGEVKVDPALIVGLEQLREKLGVPISINSGYRCPAHNMAVGGTADSQHMKGTAADITASGISPAEVARAAESVGVFQRGGIGIYSNFTHVDVRKTGVARWGGSDQREAIV